MHAERDIGHRLDAAVDVLRSHGAQFGYLHGSRAGGTARDDSDVDIAAFFGRRDVLAADLLLPAAVDLLVLDTAPLELAGRVAVAGDVVFENDPAVRIRWEATTRKIYFDERPRLERAHREFLDSVRHG